MQQEAAFLRPARAAMVRLLGHRYTQQFELRPLTSASGRDAFEVYGRTGHIVLSGTSAVALLMGLNWYLKYVTEADISWTGQQLDLPARLPAPVDTIHRESIVEHRFALMGTNGGYTGPYHDWTYWEREIDLMALQGINEVLVYTGQEAVYYQAFQEFGYTPEELQAWIPLPAHQPWFLVQNMYRFPAPIPEELIERRAALGRKIADRLRALGITPVFPGYFGTVPPGFAERTPGAHLIPLGEWVGYQRPDWMDPRTEAFERVAEAFYRNQQELFGSTTMFKMDPVLELEAGRPGLPLGEAVRAREVGPCERRHRAGGRDRHRARGPGLCLAQSRPGRAAVRL